MAIRKLAILEPILGVRLGHILTYSARVRAAAARRGVETVILGGPGARRADPGAIEHFRADPAPAFLGARTPLVSAARLGLRVGGFVEDFARALDLLSRGPATLALVPTATSEHALALALALPARALGAARIALVYHDLPRLDPRRRIPFGIDVLHKRAAFAALAPWVRRGRLGLFTDSPGLSLEWGEIAGLPFDTLPVPVDVSGARPRPLLSRPALRVLYAGGARVDKGFLLLPALARAAAGGRLSSRPVELLVHANIEGSSADADRCRAAREELRALPGTVTLVEAVLSQEEYLASIAGADVVLVAYDPVLYGQRTSGILAEALSLGRMSIATGGCWAGDCLAEAGAGTIMRSFDAGGLIEAAARLCEDLDRFAASALGAREPWARATSTDALVGRLLDVMDRPPRGAARRA